MRPFLIDEILDMVSLSEKFHHHVMAVGADFEYAMTE
jgi:hypothetical protein